MSCVLAALAQARGHCSCLSSVGQSIKVHDYWRLFCGLQLSAPSSAIPTPQRREVLAS